MTKLTYICKTSKGTTEVKTFAEAERIVAQGGTYSVCYSKVEEPSKVDKDRFDKLKKVFK